ncbi:RIB43A-domain-containing protein [Anaeromyces robustus]|uniref:RIB43A-domain-containing protein n=1 Tax=Anaeromyces robustus TaxID=1754192 RepID=A0A1Y1X483_9FUNG|nr:RIB43A-domain-containing protein [Anaeromyces robustus]|eukprot:ORX80620.1 RIB43A-domain-containing protein [Anaeromyces robustus]
MYKVEIVPEAIQEQAISRRRKMEEERKKRFFNSKVRTMGIDIEKIEEQIKKKHEMREIEILRDKAFDDSLIQMGQVREMMEQKRKQIHKMQCQDLDDYRKNQQKFEFRREFDLNDPKRLFKDKPARIGDDDPRKSVSGCQFFGGEDLTEKDRIKRQKEQMRVWAIEQMAEKAERRRKEIEEDKNFEDFRLRCSAECRKLQEEEKRIRDLQTAETVEYNKRLAELKRFKDYNYKIEDEKQNMRQIDYQLNSSKYILKEENKINPYTNRLRMDSYKGMTPKEIQDILDYQERQRQENHRKREIELENESKWDLRRTVNDLACKLLSQEQERQRREINKKINEENQKQAIADKERKEFYDKVLYTNQPTDAFYDQFNTTSR